MARLTLTGLTAVSTSTQLYSAGQRRDRTHRRADARRHADAAARAPADWTIRTPGGVRSSTGWRGAAWPTNLTRDFARIAVTDIESDLVGSRASRTRLRLTPICA